MKSLTSRILLLVLILPLTAFGQSNDQARIGRVEVGLLPPVIIKGEAGWAIKDRMKHYKVPGVSVAVINDFKVDWAKTYGVKDVETNEPVTETTLFQAGSISKPVAAMVALKKVEEGKIALEEDINNRLTSWKLPDNEFTAKKKVTLANLLSHTAGLTVHGFPGYEPGAPLPTLPQILDGAPPANTAAVRVNMEPGARFRYSGGGTTIAQLAIMDIEKRPYPKIAKDTVLDRLKMTNSTYSQPLPDDTRKKAATGHRANGSVVKGKIHVYPEMAAAGLWTTPTDLAKFAIEVQLSLMGKSNKVLSKDSASLMVTPYASDNVGMGFFVEKHGNALYFGHGGADEGFRAQLLVHKEKGYGAVVMVNSDNGQIMGEIIRAIAREYQWEEFLPAPREAARVETKILEQYAGRYRVNPDRVLTVTAENGKLWAEPTASPKFELLPVSETSFLRKDAPIEYEFVKNAEGSVDRLKMRVEGNTSEAPRVSKEMAIPFESLMAGRVDEAIEGYRKIKREAPLNAAVAEDRINQLGYTLMGEKKYTEAIAIFTLNVEMYPKSSNVYDSLAEAYMKSGNKELAIKNYKKSLELNPANQNAVEMLKTLER
ncbi:MAG TPA: serine hydrolase [Blastocatellia bacterium]|nr:serine hydrolase [Blastocatellia bacterium]